MEPIKITNPKKLTTIAKIIKTHLPELENYIEQFDTDIFSRKPDLPFESVIVDNGILIITFFYETVTTPRKRITEYTKRGYSEDIKCIIGKMKEGCFLFKEISRYPAGDLNPHITYQSHTYPDNKIATLFAQYDEDSDKYTLKSENSEESSTVNRGELSLQDMINAARKLTGSEVLEKLMLAYANKEIGEALDFDSELSDIDPFEDNDSASRFFKGSQMKNPNSK